jgi:hypothetical protein
MKRAQALQLLDSMVKTQRGRGFSVARLHPDDPVRHHRWLKGKRYLGGVEVKADDGTAWKAVMSVFNPEHRRDYYLVVIEGEDLTSACLEIHRTEAGVGGTYLRWLYGPRKKGVEARSNPRRKVLFSRRYPGGLALLPLPKGPAGAREFVGGLIALAIARRAADALKVLPLTVTKVAFEDSELSYFEGQRRERFVLHRRREDAARRAKLEWFRQKHGRVFCEVRHCEFDFADVYGKDLGKDFAQVHHLKPLSRAGGPVVTKLRDLAIVCPNCHAMIHRGGQNRKLATLIRK